MKIQLIKGSFPPAEIFDIIAQLLQVKIKFHENKITQMSSEEDIKFREARIKELQNELHNVKNHLQQHNELSHVHAEIELV